MRPYQYSLILFAAAMLLLIASKAPWWLFLIAVAAFMQLLAIGAIFIRLNFFLPALHHAGRGSKNIALTFDDGPAAFTGQILDILKAQKVPAAFFTIGERAATHALLVRRWADEGHVIGNHSFHHGFWFDMLPSVKMLAELEATNRVIDELTGSRPKLFRPPYGVTNPSLANAVRRSGMQAIGWTIRSFDTSAKDVEALTAKVCSNLKGGDIILLHDSMEVTAQALTFIIKAAREKGFTFVRLDKLLNIDPYA